MALEGRAVTQQGGTPDKAVHVARTTVNTETHQLLQRLPTEQLSPPTNNADSSLNLVCWFTTRQVWRVFRTPGGHFARGHPVC
jgi:hypothetical protein